MSWRCSLLLWIAIICIQSACANRRADAPERGAAGGKTDSFGSCVGSDCNGASPNGTCYCDDSCDDIGDCCNDKVEICDTGCSDFAVQFDSVIEDSRSSYSEVVVAADGIAPAYDTQLAKLSVVTSDFRPEKIAIPDALINSGLLIIKLTGYSALVRNVRLTHNGSRVYYPSDLGERSMGEKPVFVWVPYPTQCGGGNHLEPNEARIVRIANQVSFRIETPQFQIPVLWGRVTSCENGTGVVNASSVQVFWLEDDQAGWISRATELSRSTVLEEFQLTSRVGTAGTLWVTSPRARFDDPDDLDGRPCEVELYLEYR